MFINICYRSGFDSEVIALSVAIKFDSDSKMVERREKIWGSKIYIICIIYILGVCSDSGF